MVLVRDRAYCSQTPPSSPSASSSRYTDLYSEHASYHSTNLLNFKDFH